MIENVQINQGLKIPIVPGQHNGDAIKVGFLADGTTENIQTLMSMYGSPQAQELTIDDMSFESTLIDSKFLVEEVNKMPKLKFMLSCYCNSADYFMGLMGKRFNINN